MHINIIFGDIIIINNIENRRGLAVAIVAVGLFLILLGVKIPVFYDLILRANLEFNTYLGVFVLLFPPVFLIGKYIYDKGLIFYISAGWISGVILCRFKNNWNFYKLNDFMIFLYFGILGASIAIAAWWLINGYLLKISIDNTVFNAEKASIILQEKPQHEPLPQPTKYIKPGIYGWLYLLGLGLIVSLFLILKNMYTMLEVVSFLEIDGILQDFSDLKVDVIILTAVFSLLFLLFIFTLNVIYLFFTMSKSFPVNFMWLLVFNMIVMLSELFFSTIYDVSAIYILREMLAFVCYAVIWLLYLAFSKRVKVTFVN